MVSAETEERKASTKRFNQRNSLKEKARSGKDIKMWIWGNNALETERRWVFGGERGEGAQRWCQYEAVNTGPRLILQLSVVIKWEKSRKPPSIQTLSLLLCQDQRMEHYCIYNTAQLLKPSLLVFSCFVCCHSCYFAGFQAVQTFSKRTNLPFIDKSHCSWRNFSMATNSFPTCLSQIQHAV